MAVQVDPMKPKLTPPGIKRLKLMCNILLSTSAFKFDLRRYNVDGREFQHRQHRAGRGPHRREHHRAGRASVNTTLLQSHATEDPLHTLLISPECPLNTSVLPS